VIQEILIVPIVAVAVLGSVWKLMPAKRRLRVLMSLDARAARHASLAAWRERLLKPRIQRAAGSGCAGCAANVGTRPHHPPR
jgi:uncharacterized protein DUF6587